VIKLCPLFLSLVGFFVLSLERILACLITSSLG
jgi:hypothetical protein